MCLIGSLSCVSAALTQVAPALTWPLLSAIYSHRIYIPYLSPSGTAVPLVGGYVAAKGMTTG